MTWHASPIRTRFNGRTRDALASYQTRSGASWFASSINYLNNSKSKNLDLTQVPAQHSAHCRDYRQDQGRHYQRQQALNAK
jgi:hypothetical protein